jgi:hypothetical protein
MLSNPTNVTKLEDGSVLITDGGNNRILKVNSRFDNIRVFLSGGRGSLRSPRGTAELADKSILVADYGNHRILKVSPDGRHVQRFAGDDDNQPGHVIDHSSALNTKLRSPWSVRVKDDFVYIVEKGNHRVLKVSLNGDQVERFAGAADSRGNPIGGDYVDPDHAVRTQLFKPFDIAWGRDATYITEGFESDRDKDGNRILQIQPVQQPHPVYPFIKTQHVSWFAGTGKVGRHVDPDHAVRTQLNKPVGIIMYLPPNNEPLSMFVSDSRNNRILKLTPNQ